MQLLIRAFGWVYKHWGTMSQLIVGLVAFLLAMWPSTVVKLEEKPKYKFGIPLLVGLIAITGYIVSESSQNNLEGQIHDLYRQVSLEATKNDIQTLTDHIDSGFSSVVDAIRKLCKLPATAPQVKLTPAQPLPAPADLTVSQSRTLSSDPKLKFGLQVTIQSNQTVPVSFAIECTGRVGDVRAFLVGQSAYLSVLRGVKQNDPNTAIVRFGYPPLTPESPLVIILSSDEDIRVKQVLAYRQ